MANIFEGMQKRLFDLTTTVFGYKAIWLSSEERPIDVAGDVNYRQPNEKDIIRTNGDYQPYTYFMEYREPFFPGLKEAVDRNGIEYVSIVDQYNVVHYYGVRSVKCTFDGKTYNAFLDEMPEGFEPWKPEPDEEEDEEDEEEDNEGDDIDPALTPSGFRVENSEEHPCVSDFYFDVEKDCEHPNERP